ncbi:RTC4-like domain-containing protein [Mycena filopes]|nr:RTC4-like domain-containing protein [Mycena filopes]
MEAARYAKVMAFRPGSQQAGKGSLYEDLGTDFGPKMVNLDSDDELNSLPPRSSQPMRAISPPPVKQKVKRDMDDVLKDLKFKKKSDADAPTSKENTQRAADRKAAVLAARDSKNAVASSSTTTRPLRDNAASRNRSPDAPRPVRRGGNEKSTADANPPRPKPRARVPPTSHPKQPVKRTTSVVSIPDSPVGKGKKPERPGDTLKGKGREVDVPPKKKRAIANSEGRGLGGKGKGKDTERSFEMFPGVSPLSSPVKNPSAFLPSPLGTPIRKQKLQSSSDFPAPSPLRPAKKRRDMEEFPMNTQDFRDVSSPGKRRSLGSDSDEERDRKRYKNQPVVVAADYDEEDSELLFISPNTDPKTLCPYCDTPLPAQPTPLLTRLLEQTFKKSYRDARPSNPLGRKAPMGVFVTVCQRHRFESETLPQAEARGWPKFIEWAGLEGRVLAMREDLESILADPGDPIVYGNDQDGEEKQQVGSQPGKKGPRMRCLFWKDLVKDLKMKGSKGVKGVQGQFANFEKTQPGYYGELGSVIIHQALYDMFPLTTIDPNLVDPLTPNEFIQRILVPEVGMRLVIEDMDLNPEARSDKKQAVAVLRESASYGVAMFPEDGGDLAGGSGKKSRGDDDGMAVAELMVMERARKRRKELEIEEREEDEAWQAQQEEVEKQRVKAELAKEKRRAKRKAKAKEAEPEPVVVDLTTRPRPRPVPKNKPKSTVVTDSGSGMDTASGMDTDSSAAPKATTRDMEVMAISSSESSAAVEAVATPKPRSRSRSQRVNKVESAAEPSSDSDFPLEVAKVGAIKPVKAKAKPKASRVTTMAASEPEVESDVPRVRTSPRPRSPSASLTSGKRSTRGSSVLDLCSSSEGDSGAGEATRKPRKAQRVAAPRRRPRKSNELPASTDEDEDDVEATPRPNATGASSLNFKPLDAARRRAPAAKG